jgi:drug/metabolite transporter (DMT)-like permease
LQLAFIFNSIAIYENRFELGSYFNLLTNRVVLVSVIYLGVLSSVVAFFMMNYTLSKITAAQSAVFANLTTVVSIIAGVIFRNEPFFKFQVVGAVLIIIGVWGTNYFGRPVVEKGEEIYEKV